MEYGAIVWDPYTTNDINQLEKMDNVGKRYSSQEKSDRSPNLADLELENLQSRRTSRQLEVVECLVPAINHEELLVKCKPIMIMKPRRFEDFESANVVVNSAKGNSITFEATTEQYKNSFVI